VSRIVIVQRQVSQVDEPVYARINKLDPQSCSVIYWNDYGYARRNIDPELGIVPDLADNFEMEYPRFWIDSRKRGLSAVIHLMRELAPRAVVVSDIPIKDRLQLALALKTSRIKLVFRTDKNHLSERVNTGWRLAAERRVAYSAYDVLAPTSPLTTAYYAWPKNKRCLHFPYTTNEQKFSASPEERLRHRGAIRDRLGIAEDDYVFVSAAKFVDRENPWALIRSFEKVIRARTRAVLIAIGDGPQLAEIKAYVAKSGIQRVVFPGFIPFSQLQYYFFAADTLLHFAVIEPWGSSPQDALFAGLALITTDRVGAAQVLLEGSLRRFLIRPNDDATATERMIELCDSPDVKGLFSAARAKSQAYTAFACAQRWVAASL
jgi:glycosyltransferase involved in cell wall biosynthesis